MAQLQPAVLTDRAATPVNHTFIPRDVTAGVGTVIESSGVPIGDKRLTVSLNRTAAGRYKAILKMTVPVVQNVWVNEGTSNPAVARTSYAECSFSFDEKSSEQERNDLVGLLQSALAPGTDLVHKTIVKLEGVY